MLTAGLVMARHLGQAHNLTQQLVGVAVGLQMCREIEQWVQRPSAPCLLELLKDVPRPLIDPNEQMQRELQAMRSDPKFLFARRAVEAQLKPAYDRARLTAGRLDRQIVALQEVEAIRQVAGKQGRLPGALSDAGMPSLNDPLTGKPFTYTVKAPAAAVLEAPAPPGGTERDALQYSLTWVKAP